MVWSVVAVVVWQLQLAVWVACCKLLSMELLGLAAIVFFVGGALLVILLTGGGPAVGLLSIPVIVVIAGIILWRFRH